MKCTRCKNEATEGYKTCDRCRERDNAKSRRTYKRNPQRGAAYSRNYREHNREKARATVRNYHQNNREKISLYMKDYHQEYKVKNADVIKIRDAKYRETNKEKEKIRHKLYYENNKDRFHTQVMDRRARKKTAFVATVRRNEIFERDNWICKICGYPIDRDVKHPHPLSATIDHIIPVSKGGTHEPNNTQCAHSWCNNSKNCRDNPTRDFPYHHLLSVRP